MPLTQLAPPYPIFTDKNGDPLDAGFLYFGVVNQNPETQPIQVYYDSAFTQPAAQPLRTSNGYVMRNGSPALIYADSQFSVTVRDKSGSLVIYSPVGYGVDPASISGTVIYDDFTGDGVTTVFNLTASPSTKNATSVYIDGVYQSKNNYNTSGSALTFTTAPPLNSAIEVVSQESSIIGGASAQQITYNQGGSGAVTRTVQSRLRDFVSVKDFGAVGDGVTDDTAAIQAAIDAVEAAGGGTVIVPTGTFMVNMTGFGIFLKNNVQVVGQGAGSVLKGIPIVGTSNFVYVVSIANCSNAGISNCLIDASRPSGEVDEKQWHGIRLDGDTSNILIENNIIKECKGDGIWVVRNPGFSAPPTTALIRGNRISDVNRQDIAIVQGTDLTVVDNFGTGKLDIEADTTSYTNTGHIVSNNQFDQILISPLSGLVGVDNNIVVSGNKCNSMFVWGLNFAQITGNVVSGTITLAQSRRVSIIGNFCKAIGQLVTNGTSIEQLVVRDNTIIDGVQTRGIWLKDVVNAEIEDNIILLTASGSVGIYQANNATQNAGQILISDNKINSVSHCIEIAAVGIGNTTHTIRQNRLESTSGRSISKDGASSLGQIELLSNEIYSQPVVRRSSKVLLKDNIYFNVANINVDNNGAASIVLDGERFFTQVPTIALSGNTVSGSIVVRNCAGEDVTIGTLKISFAATTATDVLLDNIVSNSATPFTGLTATIRAGSLIRITGDATRYAVWYNGTAWANLA